MRPSEPSSCCQAIFAKRAPSGQGKTFPERAAFCAISFPRIKRKVLLSPRSVVLMSFQFSKSGSKGNPSNSGCTVANGADVALASWIEAAPAVPLFELAGVGLLLWLGATLQGAR